MNVDPRVYATKVRRHMRRFNDLSSYLVMFLLLYGASSTLGEVYDKKRSAAATDCAKADAPAEAPTRRKESSVAALADTGRRTKSRKA
eukprot:6184309-Pleurochrysis_carterae.AAC.1